MAERIQSTVGELAPTSSLPRLRKLPSYEGPRRHVLLALNCVGC